MSAGKLFVDVLDVSGGLAGASMILASILLLISEPGSSERLLEGLVALLLLAFGLVLTVRKQLRRTRAVVGAIFLALFLLLFVAAVFLPNVRRFG